MLPCLFILAAEILASNIGQTSTVIGIHIFGSEIVLSHFADDTSVFCVDLTSVEDALEIVRVFGEFSGLVVNVEKTKAIWFNGLTIRLNH